MSDEALTIQKLKDAMDEIHNATGRPLRRRDFDGATPLLWGLPVHTNPYMEEPTERIVTFPGHPIIKWLARFIRFDPDVHVVYPCRIPPAYLFGDRIIMHPKTLGWLTETVGVIS
jgi:hypothetical protein